MRSRIPAFACGVFYFVFALMQSVAANELRVVVTGNEVAHQQVPIKVTLNLPPELRGSKTAVLRPPEGETIVEC